MQFRNFEFSCHNQNVEYPVFTFKHSLITAQSKGGGICGEWENERMGGGGVRYHYAWRNLEPARSIGGKVVGVISYFGGEGG